MKTTIITIALAFLFIGCKKSDVEIEIEQLELKKSKLEYLQVLMETKENLSYKQQRKVIDSLIQEENIRIENDSN